MSQLSVKQVQALESVSDARVALANPDTEISVLSDQISRLRPRLVEIEGVETVESESIGKDIELLSQVEEGQFSESTVGDALTKQERDQHRKQLKQLQDELYRRFTDDEVPPDNICLSCGQTSIESDTVRVCDDCRSTGDPTMDVDINNSSDVIINSPGAINKTEDNGDFS